MLHHLYKNFATSFGINKIDKKYCNITRILYTVFYNHSQTIPYTKWKCNRLENEMCTQKLFWRGLFISITCHGGFAHKLSTISKQKSMENPWKICGKRKKYYEGKMQTLISHNKNEWKHKHTHSQSKGKALTDWGRRSSILVTHCQATCAFMLKLINSS